MLVDICSQRRLRWLINSFIVAFLFLLLWTSWAKFDHIHHEKTDFLSKPQQTQMPPSRKLAKVSMLYGPSNSNYERALQSHQRHCERWNCQMHVLRTEVSSSYWNKPYYLLSLIIQELAKPADERTEWLMWVDADSIILNSAVPPEIFLPPSDFSDIHVVASKDHNGLNTGIIFLRVHSWTVRMLTEALGNPIFHPEVDLGWSADQTSMAHVLAKHDGGYDGTGYKRYMIYLPRPWFNAYEFVHGFEGDRGDFLVHFPGLEQERWEHMAKWLDIVENESTWEVDLAECGTQNKTNDFWGLIRVVKQEIQDAGTAEEPQQVRTAVEELQTVLWEQADNMDLLRMKLRKLNNVR